MLLYLCKSEIEGKLNPWYILKGLLQPTHSCMFFPLYSWQVQYHTHLAEETDCIGHDLLIMHISNFNNDGSC